MTSPVVTEAVIPGFSFEASRDFSSSSSGHRST